MTSFIVTKNEALIMDNLRDFVDIFRSSMQEVLRDKPSVEGFVGGANFQQISAYMAFFYLKELKHAVLDFPQFSTDNKAQIKLWALQMESEAKRIFKDDFERWYDNVK